MWGTGRGTVWNRREPWWDEDGGMTGIARLAGESSMISHRLLDSVLMLLPSSPASKIKHDLLVNALIPLLQQIQPPSSFTGFSFHQHQHSLIPSPKQFYQYNVLTRSTEQPRCGMRQRGVINCQLADNRLSAGTTDITFSLPFRLWLRCLDSSHFKPLCRQRLDSFLSQQLTWRGSEDTSLGGQ